MRDITIGRLRGGLCVIWHDEDGNRKRYRLEARTRAEAEAEALDVYRRHNLPKGPATVAEIWEDYRVSLGDRPTGETVGYTGKAVLPHFGAYRPDQISHDMCRNYAAAREAAGKSQGTVHTELGHLRSALRHAEKAGMIDKAPHIWRPEKPTPKERWLTEAEIHALLDACAAPHIELAVHLMIATAARVGAILDLTWDRVDFERGQINLRLPDAATRKGRAIVPMNNSIRAALQSAHQAALSDYVVEYGGERVKSIRTGFTAAVRRAGLVDVNQHCLRHTAAVHMAGAGIPMDQISQYLGHSNVQITAKVYARYAPDHLRQAADVLDFGRLRSVK